MNRQPTNKKETLCIDTEADIVFARMIVRQLASEAGLTLGNQARISLAMSSLAQKLNRGKTWHGRIAVDCLSQEKCSGIRATRMIDDSISYERASRAAQSVEWLVGELSVERLQSDGRVQVTLARWKG